MADDECDNYETESDNDYAAIEEVLKYNNVENMDESAVSLMPLYSTSAEYLRVRVYMQSYNLDNNQIIAYMKSSEKANLNVRLLPSDERKSTFLLWNESVLLINPLWMNSWNRSKLLLDQIWYKASSIQYVYEIRSSNTLLIDISEADGKEIYEIIPPEIRKVDEAIVVIKKGIFCV